MGTNQGTKRGAPRLLAVTSADQIGIKEEDKKSAILKKNKSPEEEIGNWRHPVTVSTPSAHMMITGYLMCHIFERHFPGQNRLTYLVKSSERATVRR